MRLIIALLTVVLVAPALRAEDPPEGWEEFTTAEGKARTFAPKGQLKESIGGTPTGTLKVKIDVNYTASEALGMYGLAHADYPKDAVKDPKKAIAHMKSFLLKIQDARVLNEKKITYGDKKYPGIEYTAVSVYQGQQRAIRTQIYVIDGHGVALYSTAPAGKNTQAEMDKFFKSFQWKGDAEEKKSDEKKAEKK